MARKVLIVDDDRTNRLVLKAILGKFGFALLEADNGETAVEVYAAEQPDIVLMDILMPVMDGYEATRRIKSMAGNVFIPVIFLTAVTNEDALAECVRVGGDAFITKPYNHIILKAKMDAMFRIKDMNETIMAQHQELSRHHERLNKEQQIAERIYSSIVTAGYADVAGLRHLSSPISLFNGDLLLFAVHPSGGLHVLVGDFTGHGLAAATGALPVSDMFYSMTSAGFSIGDIVAQINEKLAAILPSDLFFCATILEVDAVGDNVAIWNGGMPDVLIVDGDNRIRERIRSAHLPLGILPPDRFNRKLQFVNVSPGERIYLYTDGVTEMRDQAANMLGQEGLDKLFVPGMPAATVYDHILGELEQYHCDTERQDDITFVEITCTGARYSVSAADSTSLAGREKPPMNWGLTLRLDKAALSDFDPLPLLNRSLMEIQGLHRYKEKIYTVLAELTGNAVDHGILELDSKMKATSQGFARYYQEREDRLGDGAPGTVEIRITHKRDETGDGCLEIQVHDSGAGFDARYVTGSLDDVSSKSGRGIPLVRSLCRSLSYNDAGNTATAIFRWQSSACEDEVTEVAPGSTAGA